MTSKDVDRFDDEFEAFLDGRDDLSRQLRSLPQPEPSAELDAAILARVEAELAGATANDPALPGGAGRAWPGFLNRWRAPLAMAAGVLFAFLLLLRWQAQPEQPAPLVVAQTPPPADVAPPAATPAARQRSRTGSGSSPDGSPAAKPQTHERPAPTWTADARIAPSPGTGDDAATPPVQAAQAGPPESTRHAAAPLPTPVPAPAPAASVAPPAAETAAIAADPPDRERAKAWLALIEELLKAGLRQDALAEWDKFRRAYPQHPVPEKLDAQIKTLKKPPG